MTGRRILYLAALLACGVFYLAYREWFAWFLLLGAVALPILSILLTLPAILSAGAEPELSGAVSQGDRVCLTLKSRRWFQPPALRSGLPVRNLLTGAEWTLQPGDELPTEHCGALLLAASRVRVYDCLGLFAFRQRRAADKILPVRPTERAMIRPPQPNRSLSSSWRPVTGGGFSEDHDLRLYRPGDELRRVHWKLSAKTGKLIVREPIEPRQDMTTLTLELNGSPEELDVKLGSLLWLSKHLIGQGIPHQLRCLSGRGVEVFAISSAGDVLTAMDALLAAPPAPPGAFIEQRTAGWRHHLGGAADE